MKRSTILWISVLLSMVLVILPVPMAALDSSTIANSADMPVERLVYEDAGLPGGAPELVDWFEDFDSYPPGQDMHGVGGWKGWGNDPTWTAFTTDVEAHSTPNSVDIAVDSDLVHEYAGYDTGTWVYTAWQFVPNDYSGDSSFILLNQYDDGGATNNWSTQVHFDGALNQVIADFDGETLPLIRGQWVEIRVEIDLDSDWQEFYYDDQLLFEDSWTERVSGGGILNIGAVDLFANGASSVYYDDLSLTEPPPEISVEPASLETLQVPDVVVTEVLTITNNGGSPLDWAVYAADWFEDFDSYPTGQDLHGVGGWKGWFNDPAATAYTTDVQARSAPNSVDIALTSDLVHEYAGYTTNTWRYTAWQFVPNDFSGESYFILLNQYDDSGATNNWSTQVHFESIQDLVLADGVGAGQTLPLIRGQWVEIRVEIDLVTDWQQFYYDGQLLFEGSWTEGLSGGGILSIGAVDLFANGASSVYYDDLSLLETDANACDPINEIPWLSVSPESGTTEPGESSPMDVAFDSAGLDQGVYTGTLCISSNDPVTPLVSVPLTMTVECVEVTTATISGPEALLPGEVATYTVTWEPDDATPPIDILWSNGMTDTQAVYSWPDPGDYTIVVTATNCDGAVVTDTFDVTVIAPCVEVISATISGPEALLVGETGTFSVTLDPPDATEPIDILWSNGMTDTTTTYTWDEPGAYTVVVTATNCEGAAVATDTLEVAVIQPMHYVYLPIVVKDH